jgi:hypothetical protein
VRGGWGSGEEMAATTNKSVANEALDMLATVLSAMPLSGFQRHATTQAIAMLRDIIAEMASTVEGHTTPEVDHAAE